VQHKDRQALKHSSHAPLEGLNPFVGGWFFVREPLFYLVAAAGMSAWLLPQQRIAMAWTVLLIKAVLEECVFRYGLQGWLRGFARGRQVVIPGITRANIVTSVAFTGVHFIHHPPLWAAAVFVPSLIFGWAWDRYRNILAPVVIHFVYNWCLFNG
jgi:hypothetical protein